MVEPERWDYSLPLLAFSLNYTPVFCSVLSYSNYTFFRSVSLLGDYLPETTRPQEMMKIFAFANSLVELLAVGLETFNRARYRQFVKRIGYLIR